MTEFLSTLGTRSLGGVIAVLLLALLRYRDRSRTEARWRCVAWIFLSVCLVLPFPVHAIITIPVPGVLEMPARPAAGSPAGTGTVVSPDPVGTISVPERPGSEPGADGEVDPSVPAAPDTEITDRPGPMWSPAAVLGGIWLLGAGVSLLILLGAHIRFLAWGRRWGRPVERPELLECFQETAATLGIAESRLPALRQAPGMSVPLLAGVFRPVLWLPESGLDLRDARYVFLHELTHLKRRDLLWKTLALWAQVVHWFNPAVYLLLRLLDQDTELACDQSVLRRLKPGEYRAYGEAILHAAEGGWTGSDNIRKAEVQAQ